MRTSILAMLLLSSIFAYGQESWTNLRYNKHQPGLENNPYKGFATMWDVESDFPYSIQGKLFKFNDIVTGHKQYDWSAVENFIQTEAAKGKHVYLQVNIDPVKNQQLDLPQYVMNNLLSKNEITTITEVKNNDTNIYVSPNWNNQVLMDAMEDFIIEFGKKYDNDPRVYLVHVGLYGMWGEWHIFPFLQNHAHLALTLANRTKLANAYTNNFPNTQLLARYPDDMPNPEKFGYSDGLFFEHSIGQPSWYFNNILKNSDAAESWKIHPIGGEVSPELQDTLLLQWPNVTGHAVQFPHKNNAVYAMQDITESITETNSSWLFMHHLFQDPSETKITRTEINNAIRVQKLLGYTFYLRKYKLSATNGRPEVRLNIQNKGVSPIYENVDAELAVINSQGKLIVLENQKIGIHKILPNRIHNKVIQSDKTLADGDYTVLIRLVNPLESYSNNAPAITFANETQDQDRKGWLTLGNINMTNGVLSQTARTIAQAAYGGMNQEIPGTIEAEKFDVGGHNVAYSFLTHRIGNAKNFRRYEKVDFTYRQEACNAYTVSNTQQDQWMEYTVDVLKTGYYTINLHYYSSNNQSSTMMIYLDGKEIGEFSGMTTSTSASSLILKDIYIERGRGKVLRLNITSGGNFEIDALDFIRTLIPSGIYSIKSLSGAYLYAPNNTNVDNSWTEQSSKTQWNIEHEGNNIYSLYSNAFPNHKAVIANGNCGQGEEASLSALNGPQEFLRWKIIQEGNDYMLLPAHCTSLAMDIWAWNLPVVHLWNRDPQNNNQLFEILTAASNKNVSSNTTEAQDQINVTIFPNPVSDQLIVNIPFNENQPSEIRILNLEGKILHSEITTQALNYLNTSKYKAGLIIVQVINQNTITTRKVIKK